MATAPLPKNNSSKSSNSLGFVENVRRTYNYHNARQKELSDFAPDETSCCVEFQVNGAGESLVTVDFKNTSYVDKPLLVGFGGFVRDWNETTEKSIIGKGQYPTISVVVVGYVVEDTPPLKRIYKGAKLAVVTGGNTFQKMIVNCFFTGKALVGPTDDLQKITASGEPQWISLQSTRGDSENTVVNENGNYI